MKVLFVVTAFYPEQAIGSIRITKLAKYFQEQGVSITVISLAPPPWATRDETLRFEGLEKIRWDVVNQSWIFRTVFQKARVTAIGPGSANAGVLAWSARRTLRKRIRATAQLTYTLLKAIDWSFRVRKHAKENFKNRDFDFIFCSYPSFASPLSGMQLKRLGVGKNLAVDFRDPVINSEAGRFSLRLWLQQHMLRVADVRLYVSKGVQRQILGENTTHWDLIASNGFDPQDADDLKLVAPTGSSNKILRFVYTGAMYGGKRDMRPFFQAAAKVFTDSDYESDQVIFEYAGSEGAIFCSQAQEFGLKDRVVDHGRLSRSEALALQKQSDVCLLATWNSASEQGVLTGKVFEYFLLRKPIVAVVGGNLGQSEISEVIKTIGAGHCVESAVPETFTELETWLENALDEKRATGVLLSRYNDGVNEFDLKDLAVRIRKKLQERLELKAIL